MTTLRPMEYGTPSGNDALTVRFGIEQGIFEAEGLDLRVRTVFGGQEIAAALDAGVMPVGSLGSPSGVSAMAGGKRFRVVASGCRQRAHMYLGVRRGIEGYAALRGKRIGVLSLGSCPAWIVWRMLTQHGLDPREDVTLVPLGEDYPRIVDFMAHGHIDACLATEPNLAIGEARGVLDVWAAAYEAPYLPRFQWIVRVANQDFLEREAEQVAAVLRGCRRAAHHAARKVDAFVAFVARYYDAPEDAIRRAVHRELPLYQLDCRLDMPGLQNAVDMLHELGSLPEPTRAEAFTDLRFQSGLTDPETVCA